MNSEVLEKHITADIGYFSRHRPRGEQRPLDLAFGLGWYQLFRPHRQRHCAGARKGDLSRHAPFAQRAPAPRP
jgi:hypothetical protein